MKVFFKHAEGFLNIDDENFYFTGNGVWTFALSLKEESDLSINTVEWKRGVKNLLNELFMAIMVSAMFLWRLYELSDECIIYLLEAKFSLLNTFLISFFSFALILTLIIEGHIFFIKRSPEIEEKMFKIPRHKIQHIFLEDDTMYIVFTNIEGTLKSILLKQFGAKGIYSKSFFENI